MTGTGEIFRQAGYVVMPGMIVPQRLADIDLNLSGADARSGNPRAMLQFEWCRNLAAGLHKQLVSQCVVPANYIAVQCTYFEKSVTHNWLVALHQDLSIPVKERIEHPALLGWSAKEGSLFVQPPAQVLESLVALRLHIDDCGVRDGALKVVPGSHRSGRLPSEQMASLRNERGEMLCPVGRGGGMVMSPLLLHASSKASGDSRRRVLHFLFGPPNLPYGLQWALMDD